MSMATEMCIPTKSAVKHIIYTHIYAICPVGWREISMEQSVGKCKQINFQNLCVHIYTHIYTDHEVHKYSMTPVILYQALWILIPRNLTLVQQ